MPISRRSKNNYNNWNMHRGGWADRQTHYHRFAKFGRISEMSEKGRTFGRPFMYRNKYVCFYVYLCTYILLFASDYVGMFVCVHVFTLLCEVYRVLCPFVFIYINVCFCVDACALLNVCLYVLLCAGNWTCALLCMCVHACVSVWLCIYIYIYARICFCMHVCICSCVFLCVCLCVPSV